MENKSVSRLCLTFVGDDQSGILLNLSGAVAKERGNITFVTGLCDRRVEDLPAREQPEPPKQCVVQMAVTLPDARLEKAKRDLMNSLEETLPKTTKTTIAVDAAAGVELGERSAAFSENAGFFRLRTIDVPGQLNTICREIREAGLTLQDLHMAPDPTSEASEHAITLLWFWVTPEEKGLPFALVFYELEDRLHNSPGVISVENRFPRGLQSERGNP